MIKKGLTIAVLTAALFALFFEHIFFGMKLVQEFQYRERIETKPVYQISTFDPNNLGGIYLTFRYNSKEDGKEYSSPDIFTKHKFYEVGMQVDVVTRNGKPVALLSETENGRLRTTWERFSEVGEDSGMFIHIGCTVLILVLFGIMRIKTVSVLYAEKKQVVCIITGVYTFFMVAAAVFSFLSATHHNSWDGLGYAVLGMLIYILGNIVLLAAWLIYGVRARRKSAAA